MPDFPMPLQRRERSQFLWETLARVTLFPPPIPIPLIIWEDGSPLTFQLHLIGLWMPQFWQKGLNVAHLVFQQGS